MQPPASTPPALGHVTAVASGGSHGLAVTAEQTVIAWGDDSYGQASVPAGLADVVSVAAGETHSVALRADGTVAAWGSNLNGQIAVPDGLESVVAIAAGGETSVALRRDGTAVYWGMYASGGHKTMHAPGFEIVSIGVGDTHLAAVFNDGEMGGHSIDLAPGYRPAGQPVPLPLLTAVAVGSGFLVALTRDGTVVAWGRNDYGQATPPAGLRDVVKVSAGGGSALALLRDGSVVGWGTTTVPDGLTDVTEVAAGAVCLALRRDGSIVAW